ncbi:hypothetical protein M0R45_001654 [Rubus argutus]|uniref:Uncharacterized protein n=1 Tax=Rubus argutus TaxID=59490 RepID=A0AAW1VJ83_RUBAR
MFREALNTGVYDLQAARDSYRFHVEALRTSCVGESKDFGGTLELCMPFIKLKKNDAVALATWGPSIRIEATASHAKLIEQTVLGWPTAIFIPQQNN